MSPGSPMTVKTSGLPPETNSTHLIPRVERRSARSMSPRMQERLSTVATCSSFRATASRRLIRTPAVCSAQFLRPRGAGSGLAWAEDALWMGQYRNRKIHQIDPDTGAVLRTIESNRFVTGVSWVDGELWHATLEGDQSDLRRVDPQTGEVLETIEMPPGVSVSGLEFDGGDRFFCGGESSGKVRAVRRPRRVS